MATPIGRATCHTLLTSRTTRSLARLSFLSPLVIQPPPPVTGSAPSPSPPNFARCTYACQRDNTGALHRIVEVHNAATTRMGICSSHHTSVQPGMDRTPHANLIGSSHASGVRLSPKRSSRPNVLHILAESTGKVKLPKSLGHSNTGIWRPTGCR